MGAKRAIPVRARAEGTKALLALVLLVLSGATSAWALDPHRALRQYGLAVWDTRSGLPRNSVNALWRGEDGYLWLGDDTGLVRFDGHSFERLADDGTLGATSLFGQADGTLWLGGPVGALRLEEHGLRRVSKEWNIVAFAEGPPGRLWFGGGSATGARLSRLDHGRETDESQRLSRYAGAIQALAWDSRTKTLWIAHSMGLIALRGDATRLYTREQGLASTLLTSLHVDRQGQLWIGTRGGGLSRFRDGHLVTLTARDGLPSDDVLSLCDDRDGNLWVGTTAGLARLNGGRLDVLTAEQGLPHPVVSALHVDAEGSLWIGTAGGGLARLKDVPFISYTVHEGLPDESTNAVLATRDGSVWVGTDSGLARLKDGTVSVLRRSQGLPDDRVISLAEDHDGSLWVGTEAGLAHWDGTRFAPHPLLRALREAVRERLWVRSILPDRDALWIAGARVLRVRRDGTSVAAVRRDRPQTFMPTLLFYAGDRRPWVGSWDGLVEIGADGGATTHTLYMTKDMGSRGVVYGAHADEDGTIWLATRDAGLLRYRQGRVRSYGTAQGLPTDTLDALLADDLGHFWLSSNSGVLRVSRSDLDDLDAGRLDRLPVDAFGMTDGLKSDESRFFGTPGACRAADGRLWFCTKRGLAVVDPRAVEPDGRPIPVVIQALQSDGVRLVDSPEAALGPGTGDLEIHYAGLRLDAPEKLRFRYRLEGVDADWVQAGTRRVAYYTKLRPGRYRFRVASSLDGRWGEEAALVLKLRPRFYQTRWFALLAAALVLAGAALLDRWRVARHEARERELARKVDERTSDLQREIAAHEESERRLAAERDLRQALLAREAVAEERLRIARELHDSLSQDFAGLSLQLQSVEADLPRRASESRASLRLASRMVHHCQMEARRTVHDLRSPGSETRSLKRLLAQALAPLQQPGAPRLELTVDEDGQALAPQASRHLVRVAQEAVTNAVSHAQASCITVRCQLRAEEAQLEIADDGRGFEPPSDLTESGHFGLLGMRERAAKLGGTLEIVSEPGGGTRIRLRFERRLG